LRTFLAAIYRSRPWAGPSGIPGACFLNHRSITAVTCVNSAGCSPSPFAIPCHFARQPLQHVAVACCAMNTGCPLNGVCLPSLRGFAAPNRFDTRSAASASTALSPFLSRYRSSAARSPKRWRNGDFARSRKSRSMSFVMGLPQSVSVMTQKRSIPNMKSSATVTTAESSSDPRQPRRFEKKKNIAGNLRAATILQRCRAGAKGRTSSCS
jgi:hypothetical protein